MCRAPRVGRGQRRVSRTPALVNPSGWQALHQAGPLSPPRALHRNRCSVSCPQFQEALRAWGPLHLQRYCPEWSNLPVLGPLALHCCTSLPLALNTLTPTQMKNHYHSYSKVENLALCVTPHYCQLCSGNLQENPDSVLSWVAVTPVAQGMPCANVPPTLPGRSPSALWGKPGCSARRKMGLWETELVPEKSRGKLTQVLKWLIPLVKLRKSIMSKDTLCLGLRQCKSLVWHDSAQFMVGFLWWFFTLFGGDRIYCVTRFYCPLNIKAPLSMRSRACYTLGLSPHSFKGASQDSQISLHHESLKGP